MIAQAQRGDTREELGLPPRIVAVDPGKMTGLATWDGTFDSRQLPCWDAVHEVESLLAWHETSVLVCESYTVTAATLKKTREYWSLESIGALRYMCGNLGVEFVLQSPSSMAFAQDDVLRALGWYKPSKGGHANDAARHLLFYLLRNKLAPPGVLEEMAKREG